MFVAETFSLKCYECFWSQKSIDESEYESKFQNRKSLKYPMVEGPVISSDEPPSTPEEMKECSRKECPDSRWCMKWSYISKEPQNITYTCVGNPDLRRGCFKQEIPDKHLKLEACLCDQDFCNKESSLHSFSVLNSMCIIVFSIFIYFLGFKT
ncbi:uncharacterized protein TNIN_337581 [Trichonephila inaurata madagascariensis]|uniref:Uncharacterized protein n=1 Tax=Trichonephila inaurata madagascariensis TaxID=2747483 RepID=A0A8X6WTN2_9ARAC|nr:uncharacterized protein TNIN_337581 [Trichonephila inaurata madagascariensis]